MQTIVNVQVRDQALQVNAPKLASGGVNEIKMEFSFCPLWDEFKKTAVFYRKPDEAYHVLLDDEDSCSVPSEVAKDPGDVYFGVFGARGDTVRTAEVLQLKLLQGPPLEGVAPEGATPDIYLQLLAEVGDKINKPRNALGAATNGIRGQVLRTNGDGSTEWGDVKSAYQVAQDGGYMGTEAELAQKLAVEYIDWFGSGILIPNNSDLNDYITPGKYYVQTEANAKTIANRPDGMNTNFGLFVLKRTNPQSNAVSQVLISLHSKMFLRSRSTSKWNDWTSYSTSAEIEELMADIREELIATSMQPDFEQLDSSSPDFIKHKPFDNHPDSVLNEWKSIVVTDGLGIAVSNITLKPGATYTVVFDGEEYSCEATDDSTGTVHLINMTDPPFDLAFSAEDVNLTGVDDGAHSVQIRGDLLRLREASLPETAVKATPQTLTEQEQEQARKNIGAASAEDIVAAQVPSNWKQNDITAVDYIENRPLYENEVEQEVIVERQTLTVNDDEHYAHINANAVLQEGVTYLVNFDGTAYTCKAYGLYNSESGNAFDGVAIGNIDCWPDANMGGMYQNNGNGEPFAIECFDTYLHLYTEVDGDHELEVSTIGGEAGVVIEEPYQEAIRGLLCDEANDVLFDQSVGIWGGSGIAGCSYALVEGQTYTVTFNGKEYTCKAYNDGFDECVGDLSNEPFKIYMDGVDFAITTTVEDGNYAVRIEKVQYHLREEYLPASVDGVIIRSSTAGSTKKFRITVDDFGELTVSPV